MINDPDKADIMSGPYQLIKPLNHLSSDQVSACDTAARISNRYAGGSGACHNNNDRLIMLTTIDRDDRRPYRVDKQSIGSTRTFCVNDDATRRKPETAPTVTTVEHVSSREARMMDRRKTGQTV